MYILNKKNIFIKCLVGITINWSRKNEKNVFLVTQLRKFSSHLKASISSSESDVSSSKTNPVPQLFFLDIEISWNKGL